MNNGHLNFIDDNLRRRISRAVGSAASYTGSYRSDFKDVLCFIPHIESKDSTISFTFKTSDKLSTYHLNLFAHSRDMHNTSIQKDFTVTQLVKVSISPPKYLYRGDKYDISATVSSKSADCDGIARIMAIETTESSFDTYSLPLALAGGSSSSFNKIWTIGSCDTLDVNVYYMSDKYSDGVLVRIPLKKDVQSLTESHSVVLLSSSSREEGLKHLKESFRNMSPEDAVENEETVSDILQRLISKSETPKGKDLISVMDAFCFAKMLAVQNSEVQDNVVPDTLWNPILSFRNADGGFAWFKQMPSNQSITAAALERFALLRNMGYEIPDVASSVRYLDSNQFAKNWPWWCGGLTGRQYLYVRSMFPEVPFSQSLNAGNKDRITEFRTDVRNYFSPSKSSASKDISKYDVLELALRSAVIRNVLSSESGRRFLKSLTGKSFSKSTLQRTLDKDVFHITDHAVHHPDGGSYYPNAVMPMRGMIENEAYAHSLIADVLSEYSKDNGSAARATKTASAAAHVADQVRLWLILQAQTQDWDKNLYFLNAVRSINQASDSIKRTSVLTLSNTEEKRFDSIVKSGNGMKIERILYRDSISSEEGTSGLRARIRVGDTLHRGEKIIAEYRIWNKENRSFVTVSAPREACMMPVNQLSGRYYGLKSLIVDGFYSFEPTGYRSVETDRTRYYFDVLPEETTVLKEEFFVVQDGVYSAPVIEVECSYAPMYRANGAFSGRIPVSR